jgi:hypothetical protein
MDHRLVEDAHTNGMYNMFEQHIRLRFSPSQLSSRDDKLISSFFSTNSVDVLKMKAADKKKYDVNLEELFRQSEGEADVPSA